MKKPALMGILNVTPDSFFEESRCLPLDLAIERGLTLFKQGADLLDIGGESTRPGSFPVSEEEEINRVIPVIKALSSQLPVPLSIDTIKPNVAKLAIDAGATIINDVSGFTDPKMAELAAATGVEVCLMHIEGFVHRLPTSPVYQDGATLEILRWFEKKIDKLTRAGVKQEKIILDPGIGFGKSVADNLEIIQNLQLFKAIGLRLLLGLSRKTFLRKILNKNIDEMLPATLVMNTVGLLNGADIIRVHDVAEHRDAIDILSYYLTNQPTRI